MDKVLFQHFSVQLSNDVKATSFKVGQTVNVLNRLFVRAVLLHRTLISMHF